MDKLSKKLLKIQTELKAPKGQFNKFGNYKYRSAEDILEAVKPLCKANDVLLTLSDEIVNVGDRYYIKATATVESDEVEMSVTAYAREEENKKGIDGSQITGSASSYARKYALNGLFLIDDTKDADTNAYREQQDQPDYSEEERQAAENMKSTITKNEAKTIKGLVAQYGANEADVLKFCKVDKFEDMTKTQYVQVFQMLEQKYGKKDKGTIGTK